MGDTWDRARLTVCRDVYRCHPDELNPAQAQHLLSFIALAMIEADKLEQAKHAK